ncbi:unannotated protein [freshwater metagenome]|uniref:Unannotated protein n=1 Tax=freshwater metagenome TaxID=449393 RepID=A0A6J7EJA1_9ZZZZ
MRLPALPSCVTRPAPGGVTAVKICDAELVTAPIVSGSDGVTGAEAGDARDGSGSLARATAVKV